MDKDENDLSKKAPPEKKEEKGEEKQDEEEAGPSQQDDLSEPMQPSASEKDDESAVEAIRRFMADKLGLSEGKKSEESKKKVKQDGKGLELTTTTSLVVYFDNYTMGVLFVFPLHIVLIRFIAN